jgi:glutathionylspermidine synthase
VVVAVVTTQAAGAADVAAGVRALIIEPGRIRPALYRRYWRRAQLDAMIPDLMVRGEPYLALNALVLPRQDVALLARLTATFTRVFQAAGQRVATDVPATMALGFPWAAAELLAREAPRLPLLGRFDFVQDVAGRWRLLELNADTPSGVREGIACDRIVAELLPEARGLVRPSAGLGDHLARAVLDALGLGANDRTARLVPAGGALGIVTTASELEDLSQMAYTADLLRPALAAHDVGVVLADAGNLRFTRRGLTLRGQPVQALYRYLAFETVFGTPTFIAMEEAAALGRATILNGLFGLLLQNKGLMAWIWAHRDDAGLFDAEARAAIHAHLPGTWMVDDLPADLPREHLVVKQVFGREGAEVFFGEDCTPDLWATLLGRHTYVAQELVRVAAVRAVVQTSLGPVVRDGYATVGCFAVQGAFAGFYTRFGDKITTARSKWLATYADGADE